MTTCIDSPRLMSAHQTTVIQLSILLPNIPGSIARARDALTRADVRIKAMTCSEGGESSWVHLIVDDPEEARKALEPLGKVSEAEVYAIRSQKRLHEAIADITRDFASRNVNIRNLYSTTEGEWGNVVYVSTESQDD